MNRLKPRLRDSIARVLAFALLGGLIALMLGLAAIGFAPENGFGDLAAAAVTRVVLIPLGIVVGAATGWFTSHK